MHFTPGMRTLFQSMQGFSSKNFSASSVQSKAVMIQIDCDKSINQIFPASFLRYLNFATVGFLAAHEYMHGFDATGRHYSWSGNLQNWWDAETVTRFEQKAKCFERQYDEYNWTDSDIKVDGKFTLNENIADNGGINLAYKVFSPFLKLF